jgi:hypothetical protein
MTSGQRHESTQLEKMLDVFRVKRSDGSVIKAAA